MKIETIDINHTAYLNLVKQYGGIFHQPEWLKLFDDEQMRIAGIFDNDHKIIGTFYFSLSKKLFFKHLKTTPFNPNCGLIFYNRTSNKSNALSFEKNTSSYYQLFKSTKSSPHNPRLALRNN